MIHAGVADSRQWNNESAYFDRRFRVLRYDMRGYGKSEPVDGEFSHLEDLAALLDYLQIDEPAIVMGCSIGGGVAMDYTLTHPSRVTALIMVDSNPRGLDLDAPDPPEFEEAEEAYEAGDLDLLAEIETRIWFDGVGRTPAQVNPAMRRLAYEMNRNALSLDAKGLGTRLPDTEVPAVERLSELHVPVLVIVGAQDIPYMQAAADYMVGNTPSARKETIEDAAHLANMDQPREFRRLVTAFLESIPLD
jgi:pimeloyl-ACP methyl ester carboxylesterase